jgi:hypothetical protein
MNLEQRIDSILSQRRRRDAAGTVRPRPMRPPGHRKTSGRTAPGAPRLKLIGTRGKLRIYLVDGLATRKIDIRWTMGGSDAVYPEFIPTNEVWVESSLGKMDRAYTLLHELIERRLMRTKRMVYDVAHEHANKIESHYRARNGRGLFAALRKERGQ